MNKKSARTHKRNHTVGEGLFFCTALLLISGCKNFLNGAETAAEIDSAIAYAKAPSYTISIDYPSGKGVMKSPAGGEVQKKLTDKFSLHFEPSTDCEFVSWKVMDSVTGNEFQNGEYLTLDSIFDAETSCTFTKEPPSAVKLTLKATVAPRAQIISYSPMTMDVLKDSSIQVLFDQDMDENSIYYNAEELENLIAEVGEENLLSSNLNEGKYYGYIKDGETFFKNISFADNDSYENITCCYAEPFFVTPRMLSINTSTENKLVDFTQVLVTFEKDFFYKADDSNPQSKNITMSQSKKWIYQVNDMEDTDAPRVVNDDDVKVFINSGENLSELTQVSAESDAPDISESTLFNRDKKINLKKSAVVMDVCHHGGERDSAVLFPVHVRFQEHVIKIDKSVI